jgi:hypothetical protein
LIEGRNSITSAQHSLAPSATEPTEYFKSRTGKSKT